MTNTEPSEALRAYKDWRNKRRNKVRPYITEVTMIKDNTCESPGIGIEGRFQPLESFSVFANKELSGTWTLIVTDLFSGDDGGLIFWTIENCETIFFEPGVILRNNTLS